MKVKTLKVLLVNLLLNDGGGEADVDDVVDDDHFFMLGFLSLYLSLLIST
jgi:hypothetical protein